MMSKRHPNAPREFVELSRDRSHLTVGGRPFYFAGTNAYYAMTRAADPSTVADVSSVLDEAAAAGLTVVRLWAFADGEQWGALQPSAGQYEERVFRALDWVVAEAAARGLRLLPCLLNYWPDYGGMQQYVRWSLEARGLSPPATPAPELFYQDSTCQQLFRRFVGTLLCRVNTYTGIAYRDDPTIMGWSVANEPQCHGDASCRTIGWWVHETATFVKALAPRQLVTVDCEGFIGPSTPDECCHNPSFAQSAALGCDFAQDCSSPALDFVCCHAYPDLWEPNSDEEGKLRFALGWLESHARLAQRLRLPLVLSEFGKKPAGRGRESYYRQVLAWALCRMSPGGGVAGTCFWLAATKYADHDGFTVYLGEHPRAGQSGGNDDVAAVIAQHAVEVAALSAGPAWLDACGGGGVEKEAAPAPPQALCGCCPQ